jgi:hypothetical protein
LRKGLLEESKRLLLKDMIGGTRNESSIRLQKQAHIKREFYEIEEDDGAYVSKPGTNACMASNHKSLHICFWIITGGDLSAFQQNWR